MGGAVCTIQKSSNAMKECIWLGAEEIGLKEFLAGRQPAWQDVTLPDDDDHCYIANNRMELSREQVEELLPILQMFVDTGEIKPKAVTKEDGYKTLPLWVQVPKGVILLKTNEILAMDNDGTVLVMPDSNIYKLLMQCKNAHEQQKG
jgi:hypothetical protein